MPLIRGYTFDGTWKECSNGKYTLPATGGTPIDFRHGACITAFLDDRQLAPKTEICAIISTLRFVFCHLGSW